MTSQYELKIVVHIAQDRVFFLPFFEPNIPQYEYPITKYVVLFHLTTSKLKNLTHITALVRLLHVP